MQRSTNRLELQRLYEGQHRRLGFLEGPQDEQLQMKIRSLSWGPGCVMKTRPSFFINGSTGAAKSGEQMRKRQKRSPALRAAGGSGKTWNRAEVGRGSAFRNYWGSSRERAGEVNRIEAELLHAAKGKAKPDSGCLPQAHPLELLLSEADHPPLQYSDGWMRGPESSSLLTTTCQHR